MTSGRNNHFQELPPEQELIAPFGVFRVRGGIAFGRCCEVYEGEDCVSGGPVALKVFRRHQDYQGALQRELIFLRTLATPDAPVVQHLGELEWQGRDVLVQELLKFTARDILLYHDDLPCSPWLVTTLAAHIVRGLIHLHDNGVVHADLKPPNIMWSAQVSGFKLIDFGVSFTTKEKFTHAVQSKGYQAPESIYWNKKRAEIGSCDTPAVVRPGIPSDVWSAGCIVAEAIVGCQLFPSFCETNVNKAVKAALSSSAANYSPQFLDGAYDFITRCLQISPGDRASPRELLSSPWLAQAYRPTFHDLSLLRTTVLRVLNVADAHQLEGIPEGKVVENYFLQLCKKHGDVIDYHLEVALGAFFVQYHQASDAEEAYYILSKTIFNDRTLIVTFFDLDLWQQRELY
ncbi:serine/threonine-protein kinase Kist-like [Penaeus monodon]|uniref:serine/threonine-protein kinase Kist-like n=1 Tax=Penaeus monodon TaxID=6687 RepID=UPI0018A71314|nr:serine/threonine-protein kinase Kist-like [Penaeus monodon]